MKKAGLVESARRAYFNITQRGLEVLSRNPPEINQKFLEQFPEFQEFKKIKHDKEGEEALESENSHLQTPQESLEYGYQKIRRDLAQELLTLVKQCSPAFFERLVVELLLKWDMEDHSKMQAKLLARAVMVALTELLKKISWG